MKIKTKIFWSAFIPGAILIAVAMIIFFKFSAGNLEDQIKNRLQTVVNERAEHIETCLTENENVLKLISGSFIFKDFLSTDKSDPEYNEFKKNATQRLADITNRTSALHAKTKLGFRIC